MITAIIGCHYGDEGKGLATDFYASGPGTVLVIRHNGGAQSGHTVEIGDRRFVFHELSSGSFRGADTYWAPTFFPDLYKLGEELDAFGALAGSRPKVLASPVTPVTTIDDVLINMLLESSRGEQRHGSCGMGINEADLRTKAGFGIRIGELASGSAERLRKRLQEIRREYSFPHLQEYGLFDRTEEPYAGLLRDDGVLNRYAETVFRNLSAVILADPPDRLFLRYDDLVFENGQGLRLDGENREEWPHVTASRTGLPNVIELLDSAGLRLDRAVYVSRSYLTRHGAGCAGCESAELSACFSDRTNTENPWQGRIRYARFPDPDAFLRPVLRDLARCPYPIGRTLFLTHLNETESRILFEDRDLTVSELLQDPLFAATFDSVSLSASRDSALTEVRLL